MPFVISVIAPDGIDHGYICEVDFEQGGPKYPTGFVRSTFNIGEAIKFDVASDAVDFMMTQSKTCPLRPDGEPNRPLRALNLHVMKVDPNKLN